MTSTTPSNRNQNWFQSLNTRGKARYVAFTLVALVLLGLNLVMTPPQLLLAGVVGWGETLGVHQIHDMTIGMLFWLLLLIPLALLLYRPTKRVNTVLAPLILTVPVMVMAYLADSFLFPGFVIGSILAIAVLVLHPAGRDIVHLERVEQIDRRLAGLYIIGALPILVYGGFELVKQLGPVDDHVLFVHFGAMTVASLFIVIMGGLAVVRQQDWRFATLSTGIVAAFVGAVSIAYPGVESSLGLLGGGLLITWAIIFVAAVELSRAGTDREDNTLEEAISKPA